MLIGPIWMVVMSYSAIIILLPGVIDIDVTYLFCANQSSFNWKLLQSEQPKIPDINPGLKITASHMPVKMSCV